MVTAMVVCSMRSWISRVALLDGAPLVLWGAVPIPATGAGVVWLIATTKAEQFPLHLHRQLARELAILHAKFPRLVAYSDECNPKHHDWLEWLGFVNLGYDNASNGRPTRHYERIA